jgi:hypothetical protein
MAAANTCTSSTGVVTGADPSFLLSYKTNNDQGLVLLIDYTRTAAYDLTITIDTYNPSVFPTGIATGAGLAIGSTVTKVSSAAFNYVINGGFYYKAAVAVGTIPGNDVIAATKYGAVAFDIDKIGTIFAIEATDQTAQEFTTAALAVAALPSVVTGCLRIGYVTATKSDGAFTFGTTSLAAANSTVAYTSTAASVYRMTALTGTALSAYTMVIAATGKYRIPLPIINSEKMVIANLTIGTAAGANVVVANFTES